jgi:hypothetical protein
MHSISLYRLSSPQERDLAARLANLRPLSLKKNYYSTTSSLHSYEHTEDIKLEDLFHYALLKRFKVHFDKLYTAPEAICERKIASQENLTFQSLTSENPN